MMNDENLLSLKLDQLRTELVDLAFDLECKGRPDAAEVAIATSARIGELAAELQIPEPRGYMECVGQCG